MAGQLANNKPPKPMPSEKAIVEPGPAIFISLQEISRKLSTLTKSIEAVKELDKAILKELRDEADKGEYIIVSGTASTDLSANITDLLAVQGHPVKGYIIKNDGANTLQVGHNITKSSIDSNIPTASARFYQVFAGEQHKEMFNRKVIRNVYVRTSAGTSAYRMWLLW